MISFAAVRLYLKGFAALTCKVCYAEGCMEVRRKLADWLGDSSVVQLGDFVFSQGA